MADTKRGRFVWYDLMTTDPEQARTFYGELTGWTTTPWQGDEPYDVWVNGEHPIGGLMQLPPEVAQAGAPPHWLGYVEVADVGTAVARAVSLGGGVLKSATEIPGAGEFAVLSDPQGGVIAIYRGTGDSPMPEGEPGPGQVSWHELMTTHVDDAWGFYHAMFGWEKTEAMDMGEAGIYQMFGWGDGVPQGGIFNTPPGMELPGWLYYIMVQDVDAAAEPVKTGGGRILNGPMEVPGGDRIVQCMDPQGAAFALHARAG